MLKKRYEYWSKEGKKFTSWFPSISKDKPEYQFYDKRISSRLLNEYESVCSSSGC